MNSRKPIHYVVLILLSLAWASAFFFTKCIDIHSTASPFLVADSRAVLGGIFLIVLCVILKKPWPAFKFSKVQYAILMLSGALIGYLWLVIAISERTLPAGVASLMPASTAIFSWALCVLMRQRRFNFINFSGILISMFGLVVMVGLHVLLLHSAHLSAVMILSSGFFALSVNSLVIYRFFSGKDMLVVTTLSVLCAAGVFSILMIFQPGSSVLHLSLAVLLSLVGAGVISTGIGYALFFWLVEAAGPVFTSLFGYLVPIFGLIMGVLFLGEAFWWHYALGIAVVMSGLVLVNYKTASAKRRS
jgi:drug/metabolite transporter (DMT)-like permease